MKLKQYDIVLLLSSLVVFSCGIGVWQSGKSKSSYRAPLSLAVDIAGTAQNALEDMTDEEIVTFVRPLGLSRSIEKIADTLKGIPADRAQKIAQLLIKDPHIALRTLDKKELILALAVSFSNPSDQDKLLDLYLGDPLLHTGRPLLVIATADYYRAHLPLILEWIDRMSKRTPTPTPIKTMIYDSYAYAVDHNDTHMFALLVKDGVPLDAADATDLLWHLVEQKKTAALIPILVSAGADINQVKNKSTPLIQAIKNGGEDTVQALVTAGADVNKAPDKTVGTPLQQSFIIHNTPIEMILRANGAHE